MAGKPVIVPAVTEQGFDLLNPQTGELVSLEEATVEDIAHWLGVYTDAQERLKDAKRRVDAEVARRADFDATYHFDTPTGRVTVTGPSPEIVWDVEKLAGVLRTLVTDEEISALAADACIIEVKSYKINLNGINALLKLGGHVAKMVKACSETHEPTRRASLRRTRPS